LFETKYWLNRILERKLIPSSDAQSYSASLTDLARQLNSFRNGLKSVKYETRSQAKTLREDIDEGMTNDVNDSKPLFSDEDLSWLNA
jgi:hypothetical protein